MATWRDLQAFIRSNYKISEDTDDFFIILFELGNLRSQLAFIQLVKGNSGATEWVQISSPVGDIPLENINDALERLDDKLCGGLVKIGTRHFVRHNLQLDDLSIDEFVVPLKVVVSSADELEGAFIGGDDN
ncbi:hypothetical protein NZK32_09830 [Cyanobium sp. FGCU-52]|nr:hypothetical protein [Cyanobium sp. FGCU52]